MIELSNCVTNFFYSAPLGAETLPGKHLPVSLEATLLTVLTTSCTWPQAIFRGFFLVLLCFCFCFVLLIRYIGLKVYVCFNSSQDFLAFLNWVIFQCIDIALFSYLLIDQCLLEFHPQFIYCEYFCNKHRHTCLLETLLSILLTKKFGVWQLKRILSIKLEVFFP